MEGNGMLDRLSTAFMRVFGPQKWIYSLVGRPNLRKAGLDILPDEFSSVIVIISFIAAIASFTVTLTVSIIDKLPLDIAPALAIVVFMISAFIIKLYPDFIISEYSSVINLKLPFIVSEMATLSDSGMTLDKVIESIYQLGHEKAIRIIFMYFVRDMRLLGMDIISALDDAASRSPSRELANFFMSLKGAMVSGSDVSGFLKDYTQKLMVDRKISLRYLTERLNVMAEAFTTVFIVLPVVVIVMLLLLLMISSTNAPSIYLYLMLVTYGLIPLMGVIFVLLMEALGPR
jgi:flagellar protein FlaJ